MIFVVLGTQKFQLNRLLINLDKLLENKKVTEEVFAQIGHSDYIPKNYSYIDFLDTDEFEQHIKKCDLLITHSGVGTIIAGMNYEKTIIVYPRLKKYKEHVDDHQIEIGEAFRKKKFVLCCNDGEELYDFICKSRTFQFKKYTSSTDKIVKLISEFLE